MHLAARRVRGRRDDVRGGRGPAPELRSEARLAREASIDVPLRQHPVPRAPVYDAPLYDAPLYATQH